jgi:hypothetical protein
MMMNAPSKANIHKLDNPARLKINHQALKQLNDLIMFQPVSFSAQWLQVVTP